MHTDNDARPSGGPVGSSEPSGGHKEKASLGRSAVEFAQQSEKLSHQKSQEGEKASGDIALEARFITPQDPVIVTAEGNRLPAVPLEEAHKLNLLREELETNEPVTVQIRQGGKTKETFTQGEGSTPGGHEKVINLPSNPNGSSMQKSAEGNLKRSMPPSHTNPLFPPLPLYGPPSILRDAQCMTFRVSSFFLSLSFLGVIVLGALFTSLPPFCYSIWLRLTFRNPDARRPFYEEEKRRQEARKERDRAWRRRNSQSKLQQDQEGLSGDGDGYVPTEGGPDPVVCDVGYYARRVGLNVEEFQVQTEDGFIIDLWHVYDPKEYTPLPEEERAHHGPEIFGEKRGRADDPNQRRKFPVLLMHGLLQSSGAYCVNDDDSLAFYLCKSGYDVWLGNNRCGFKPKHVLLEYPDPRMWAWNIRQMGVFDLPALTSRVLYETGFEKIGLICHSQGTTQTFVALAKEQRPELGEKLTVFCALAPAAYAGPLIGKMYFKFMRIITPAMFRLMFGIHAFIPLMMAMHSWLHPRVYGWLGYKVFSFLFNWTNTRWDRALNARMFQFAPVYVSAESMRWWLGRECFAKHKCILATKEEWRAEEREDEQDQYQQGQNPIALANTSAHEPPRRHLKGASAWYNAQAPPFALWVCGNDDLVDGGKLLRRFERGREPHVQVVHQKVIKEYEHLDVLWAMDAVDQVFKEVREVLWKTCNVRDVCRVPKGCENVEPWVAPVRLPSQEDEFVSSSSSSEELLS